MKIFIIVYVLSINYLCYVESFFLLISERNFYISTYDKGKTGLSRIQEISMS